MDERAVHLLVEIKVKVIEGRVGVAEGRLFVPALEEAVLRTQELGGHERRHEIDQGQLGLGMARAGFEDVRHA